MTIENPTPGNAPGLPEYLADLQTTAIRLSGVMAAISHLNNEGKYEDGQIALIDVAEQLANELSDGLDSVSLPRGALS